jgi:L-alanine-DL-glutamate epimerase-like enolase superfamily enzyme
VWTIVLDDPDTMARAAAAAAGRFKALKLKLGGRDGLDVERVRAVRAATELPIQVDVNEGWSYDEAVDNIAALADCGVVFVEQPLPAGDADGPRVKRESRLPIVVDEDCHSPADVRPCAERAHGINIKLAKCGGILEALDMIRSARELELYVMLGCMGESSLGLAPACAIASLCDHVDLDGNLPLKADPWAGVELVDGVQVVSDAPGLGVTRR